MGKHRRFAVGIRNRVYLASLELRKLYEVIDDSGAEKDRMMRAANEPSHDYLFPAYSFDLVYLPSD